MNNHHGFASHGLWNIHDDRDLSRVAAERHFLLQAVAESQPRTLASPRARVRRRLTRHLFAR